MFTLFNEAVYLYIKRATFFLRKGLKGVADVRVWSSPVSTLKMWSNHQKFILTDKELIIGGIDIAPKRKSGMRSFAIQCLDPVFEQSKCGWHDLAFSIIHPEIQSDVKTHFEFTFETKPKNGKFYGQAKELLPNFLERLTTKAIAVEGEPWIQFVRSQGKPHIQRNFRLFQE